MRLALLFAASVAFLGSSLAHADAFTFSATGTAGGFSGSGTLTTVANGDGSFTIVGITGPGITGLIAPGQFEFNDNLLFPSQTTLLDVNGFSFSDVMGNTGYDVNIGYDPNGGDYFVILQDTDGDAQLLPITFNVAATPEPSSIALLGTGVLGMAGLMRRRLS